MDFRVIEKYFEGKASPREINQVLLFFKNNHLDPKNEKMLQDWWNQFQSIDHGGLSGKLYETIRSKINSQPKYKKNHRIGYGMVAAVVAFLMVSILFIYNQHNSSNTDQQVPTAIITKQAIPGTKLKFELPDGSIVNLNAGSKLVFPEKFDSTTRMVTLEGEAYFDVVRNIQQPFIVECNGVVTTVLGTSFNISSDDQEKVIVSLASGKVKVDHMNEPYNSIYLSQGEQVIWDIVHNSTQVQKFDLYKTIAWKEGTIIFDESGISEIIEIMESWYGVDIQVEGVKDLKTVKWRYSGEFKNESLEIVLNGIAYVKDFDFKIEGKKVLISLE